MLKKIAASADGEALPTANFNRRLAMMGGLSAAAALATSIPAIAGAVAVPVTLTLQQKADNVRHAAEALARSITALHDMPCKISIGDNVDCVIVMTRKPVQS
jgi:hypothetical protein